MFRVRDFSIRTKLIHMIMLTSISALLIATTVFIFNDRSTFRSNMADNLDVLAEVIAANSASAISFEDQAAATEILAALGADEHIVSARLLTLDGKVFSKFDKGGHVPLAETFGLLNDGHRFENGGLIVTKAVTVKEKPVGTLLIKSDLTALDARLTWFLGMTLIIALAIGLLSVSIAMYFQRMISRPIVQLARAANAIAVGDINQQVDYQSGDEIGKLYGAFRNLIAYMKDLAMAAQRIEANDLTVKVTPKSDKDVLSGAFQNMVASLARMVTQLRTSAGEMVSAASEISSSSNQMLRGARDQAEQIRSVSTAIEEISSTILASADNVQEATSASKTASETASSGGQLVEDTIKGMQKIEQVVRESAVTISKLAQSSQQIGQIVSVINDIADQTNLLALNAAIEAARAGEQGRGFAVVADEVRKLAERTGKATGEIVQMVRAIQDETVEAVDAVKVGIKDVDHGRELANRAGENLHQIVDMTRQVMGMIQQIAMASREQSSAAEEISKNIGQISSVTKETAIGAEQSSTAAGQLNNQAEALRQMVDQFRI